MEEINNQMDELFNTPGVSGVVFTDLRGLVLKEKGSGNLQAGAVSTIALQASKLFPDLDESPVVCVEGEKRSLLIRNEDKIVLGVYKDKL